MSKNDSSQVRSCLNQTDSSVTSKASVGETSQKPSQNDSRNNSATQQPPCSKSGASGATNQPQSTEAGDRRAANQPSQNQSMGGGSVCNSSLNSPTSGVRSEDTYPFCKLMKLQACDMGRLSCIRDHTALIDVRLHLNIMWATVGIFIVQYSQV